MRAGLLLTDTGYFVADAGCWRGVIFIIAAVLTVILLITQLSTAARFEKGAEAAFSQARQLLREADQENRKVRPLPVSLAKAEVPRQLV